MALHESTFEYLPPTEMQQERMELVCHSFRKLACTLDYHLPDGPDKTYVLRKLRECAMWSNVCITRQPDGAPRGD